MQIADEAQLPGGVARRYLNEEWATQKSAASSASRRYSYKNVLAGFYNGNKVIDYCKQVPYLSGKDFEYHWYLTEHAMVMDVPETNKKNSVVVDGVKLGFEICAEHQYGILGATTGGKCDLHVLLSNSMEEYFDQLVSARVGGVFAHVDAKTAHCALYRVQPDSTLKKIEATRRRVLDRGGFKGQILEYEVEIRIPIRLRT